MHRETACAPDRQRAERESRAVVLLRAAVGVIRSTLPACDVVGFQGYPNLTFGGNMRRRDLPMIFGLARTPLPLPAHAMQR